VELEELEGVEELVAEGVAEGVEELVALVPPHAASSNVTRMSAAGAGRRIR
jgi:hypothetical protein